MILESRLALAERTTNQPGAPTDWVHQHYDDIYRFLKHLTRHTETAEDLAQQTFVQACQAIQNFRGDSSLKTWLHRIAFREYIAWRRKRKVTLPLDILRGRRDPAIEQVDDRVTLLGLLHQLPSGQRESFLMYEVQQLSIEEISTVTGVKPGTIKSHLHYARQKLQSLLNEAHQENPR
ncbi:MAG: RNA polymerase sigma factor [Armatimonadetes bacterium]|nr:RNA polymerase sigma factor [Armatimonadota bacterium]